MLQLRLTASVRLILVSLALLFVFIVTARRAEAQEPPIFLPFLIRTGAPPLPPYKGALFADTDWRTSSASIAVDAKGGMHLAYAYYVSKFDNPPTYGVYYYCPAQCDKEGNWQGVGLGENVNEIQVALTPQGQPRVLFRSWTTEGNDFYYAACDVTCPNPAKWTVIYLTSNRSTATIDLNQDELPQRYFALDPAGRPRFVYSDRDFSSEPDHYGEFYAFCDESCTDPAHWFEVLLNKNNGQPPTHTTYRDENYAYPALAFTPQGQPRIVADGVSLQDESYLFYLACEGGCQNSDNWQTVPLYPRGSGVEIAYDIELNKQGQPRVGFYQGALLGGQGDRLSYAWCNGGCLNPAGWQRRELGLSALNGQDPDLELDANGLPRIAYVLYDSGGLGYSWCNSNCETLGAAWQHQVIESRAALAAKWPVAYPPHCDGGLWDGESPTLSLDGSGNPRIAYDIIYEARCNYLPETGEWKPVFEFHQIWRAVRVNFFPKP